MSEPNEYLCPAELVALVEHANLSLDALRVFHALCFITDKHPTFKITSMARPARRSLDVLSRKLIACTFPQSTNDLRVIGPAMSELGDARLIESFEFGSSARNLSFRFPRAVIEAYTSRPKNGQFAMIDTSMLSCVSSSAQLLFYTRVAMHAPANAPEILHTRPRSRNVAPGRRSGAAGSAPACKLSRVLPHGYLFCPEVDFASDAVIRMRVKISHDATTWFPGRLYHRVADKPPVAVFNGSSVALTRGEMRAREHWTQVQGPT